MVAFIQMASRAALCSFPLKAGPVAFPTGDSDESILSRPIPKVDPSQIKYRNTAPTTVSLSLSLSLSVRVLIKRLTPSLDGGKERATSP